MTMMTIDPREGSVDLVDPLREKGITIIDDEYLRSGDVSFVGRGEGGQRLRIGIEYKKLPDYLASMKGRLQAIQVPRMVEDYDRRYLIIEGEMNYDSKGRLLRRAGRNFWKPIPGQPGAAEVIKKLIVMELRGGIYTIRTHDFRETLLWVYSLYRVWTDSDLDAHKSHLAIHAPDLDERLLEKHSLVRTMAAQLPGVGYLLSKQVEDRFPSVREMVRASVEDWKAIDGIGKKKAQTIYNSLRNVS
jgi:ERCC4-type nuclease